MIYSTIVCVIFFAAAAMWLVRFIKEAGVSLQDNRVLSFITADKNRIPSGETSTARECLYVFIIALAFRVVVFIGGWFACGIFDNSQVPSFLEYCSKWNLWDAPHYLEIAENGYGQHIENGQHLFLVFFPLYPLFTRIFHFIIPNYLVSSLAVSTVCYAAGCVLMYKLVIIDYSKSIARMSLIFMSVYPFAFYFGGIMTESVFFLMIMASFLAIRKHKWLYAGIFGAFAALTRSFGVLMIIPAAVEWVQSERPISLMRDRKWKELGHKFVRVLPILIMPVGTLIYLFINYKIEGNALIFMKYQSEHWHMNLQFFGKTLHMLWENSLGSSYDWSLKTCLFIPELIALPVFAAGILYSVRRTRSMYMVFMLIYYIFNAAASWPLSLSRYLSCMFPIFWVMADFTDKHKWLESIIAAVFAIGFGIYLTGYITCHQIM